ncbi:MAG TPA: hypothetical protein VGL42_01900 [Opitutaceae bacterium]|jgi:hypothetical protein
MFSARTLVLLPIVLLLGGCSAIEGDLLYHPSHHANTGDLKPWRVEGEIVGYARVVDHPRAVWLMLHGNGLQAADRGYVIPHFTPSDSVYVLEYPGYGGRPGKPSKATIDAAAVAAYRQLRGDFPNLPICVASESFGSGPACLLARESRPPDKIVLVVPFDRLSAAAREHYPRWMVDALAVDDWDNIAALSGYRGPVVIYGAMHDETIPMRHARALAAAVPGSQFHAENCGHSNWGNVAEIVFRYP